MAHRIDEVVVTIASMRTSVTDKDALLVPARLVAKANRQAARNARVCDPGQHGAGTHAWLGGDQGLPGLLVRWKPGKTTSQKVSVSRKIAKITIRTTANMNGGSFTMAASRSAPRS